MARREGVAVPEWVQVQRGTTIVGTLQPGEDVLTAVREVCRAAGIRQGWIPVFSGAFRSITVIGTSDSIDDVDAPLADSVTVHNAEGLGSGTVTTGAELEVHLHVAVGEKGRESAGTVGHLLAAEVQYPVEIVIEEAVGPELRRSPNPAARGLSTLTLR